jgi:hypothetical protein
MSGSVNGGTGQAPDEGAGSAPASTGTGSSDTRPPTAGSSLAGRSDGSGSVNGGTGQAADDGAGSALASPGIKQPLTARRPSKAASSFWSSLHWVSEYITENQGLIDRAATTLADSEQELSEKDAKEKIEMCLRAIENLVKPLDEPTKRMKWRSRMTEPYTVNRFTELDGQYIRIRAELLANVTNNPERGTDKYAQSAAESMRSAYGLLKKRESWSLNATAHYLSQADAFTAST